MNTVLEKLVGRRYETLELLKNDIETLTKRKVGSIIESTSDRSYDDDYMFDYFFDDDEWDIKTMFYIQDNGGRYYITEA